VPDSGFSLAKISFGDILTPTGAFTMLFGFGAYFQLIPGTDLSGLALIYGFPALLLGFALKYAQLEPVPCQTTREAFEAREAQMTDNLKQVREDCTRFRCAHVAVAYAAGPATGKHSWLWCLYCSSSMQKLDTCICNICCRWLTVQLQAQRCSAFSGRLVPLLQAVGREHAAGCIIPCA
jgi:Protein of unknown function (DUF2854)